jgi:hypothetical protein
MNSMTTRRPIRMLMLSMMCLAGAALDGMAAEVPAKVVDPPETVVVTYRPKAGKEAELEALIQRHWKTISGLGMVLPEPHLLFRGQDGNGATFFVNIITWKTHAAPDSASPEVEAIWTAMQADIERRDCRRGIEFDEVWEVPIAAKP